MNLSMYNFKIHWYHLRSISVKDGIVLVFVYFFSCHDLTVLSIPRSSSVTLARLVTCPTRIAGSPDPVS